MNRSQRAPWLGCLLCGLALAACGREAARPTAAKLPPETATSTVTATVFHTGTPSPSPTPSPTLDPVPYFATSLALKEREQYEQIVSLWDEYLPLDPGFVDGYYQRATGLNWGAPGSGSMMPFLSDNVAALRDLDLAVSIGPVADGRIFWRRYQVLADFISVEPYRAYRDAYTRLALDNVLAANAIGPWSDVSRSVEIYLLADLDRCDEALELASGQLRELELYYASQSWSVARGHAAMGRAYNCAGNWVQAVNAYEQAFALVPEGAPWRWEYWRSVNLYFLGRVDEALEFLDRHLAEHPNYAGERYFTRALILYDQGKIEEARADNTFGLFQTWVPNGVYSYVAARLAVDDEEPELGLALLREAEAKLWLEYRPLLDRIRREIPALEARIEAAGQSPSSPPATAPAIAPILSATPMPLITPTSTPRTPFAIRAVCGCDARTFDVNQGTGPILVRSELELNGLFSYIYRFQPTISIADGSAVDLTYRIIPFGEVPREDSSLELEFYRSDSSYVVEQGNWGDNRVADLSVLGNGGEITLVLRNKGILPVYLQDFGVRVVSQDASGGYLIQQAVGIPFMEAQSPLAPNLDLNLDESSGPMSVPPDMGRILRFSPSEAIDYAVVESLEVRVKAQGSTSMLPVLVVPWNSWDRHWMDSAQEAPGLFIVDDAASATDAWGTVLLAIMNQEQEPIDLSDVSLRLVYRDGEGAEHIVGSSTD